MGRKQIDSWSLLASKFSQLVSSRFSGRARLQKRVEGRARWFNRIKEALAAKPKDPRLLPETHMVEGEK